MTKRKTPFFFTFKGLSNSPIFQYLNFSFHRHLKGITRNLTVRETLAVATHSADMKTCVHIVRVSMNAAVSFSSC